MDVALTVSSILILIGAAIMLVNIVFYKYTSNKAADVQQRDSSLTKSLVRVHLVFMGFFFLGYLVVLYLFLNHIKFSSSLFVAVIFFFGSVFVFMGIVIQKRMLMTLRTKNDALKEYNEKLTREQDRLLDLNRQLELEMENRIRAEKSDQLKSDFLSLVSHELRTPLTSIFGFTKLLEKGVCSLQQSDDAASFEGKKSRLDANLGIVSTECERLTRLVNNFLDLAKIESGRMEWHDDPHSLHSLLENALTTVQGLVVDKESVEIQSDIPETLPEIIIDGDRLVQVLINLLNNAVKFTDKGVVTLSAAVADSIKITVSDQAGGIQAEDLERIFDKFYIVRSGDTLGGKKMGTGLGLPICKQIIEHYEGRIWVESEINKGSTFHIELPISLIV